MGADGKRKLRLRHMVNEELFKLYDSDLVLRLKNAKDLGDHRKMLARFREYLNDLSKKKRRQALGDLRRTKKITQ